MTDLTRRNKFAAIRMIDQKKAEALHLSTDKVACTAYPSIKRSLISQKVYISDNFENSKINLVPCPNPRIFDKIGHGETCSQNRVCSEIDVELRIVSHGPMVALHNWFNLSHFFEFVMKASCRSEAIFQLTAKKNVSAVAQVFSPYRTIVGIFFFRKRDAATLETWVKTLRVEGDHFPHGEKGVGM